MCYTRAWRVYGAEGHRQRESFHHSVGYDWSDEEGIRIVEVLNSDITGTNAYSIIRITRDTPSQCEEDLYGQESDGVFENSRTGFITEIKESEVIYNKEKVKDAIKETISPLLDKAYSLKGAEVMYWLEQLPMTGEYDSDVHGYISKIEYSINHNNYDLKENYLDDLSEMYYYNLDLYKEEFVLDEDCYVYIDVGYFDEPHYIEVLKAPEVEDALSL